MVIGILRNERGAKQNKEIVFFYKIKRRELHVYIVFFFL